MALTLTLREPHAIPIEVDMIRHEEIRGESPDRIQRRSVIQGNRMVELGELFDVDGSAVNDETVIWRGDCGVVKRIAEELSSGIVKVEGNCGMHTGAGMTGGRLEIHGNAGDWLGAEMSGGRIVVHGDAGNLTGAAYRGAPRGMTGGEILVHGNAGNEVGCRMRRGLIAVAGRTGDAPGYGLIAGCLCLFGAVGNRPGAGMKRGTIALLGAGPQPQPPASFRQAGRAHPVIVNVMLRYLSSIGMPVPHIDDEVGLERFNGDFLALGKGELLYFDR